MGSRFIAVLVANVAMAPSAAVFAQLDDPTAVVHQASLPAPAVGGTVVDPAFGVEIRRLTGLGEAGGLSTAEYPQLQAVNADETRILVSTFSDYKVFDISSSRFTHEDLFLSMPRWSPVDPDIVYSFNQRSGGQIWFQETELMPSGGVVTRNLVDISALGFADLDFGCWEDLSGDARYVPLLGTMTGMGTVAAVLEVPTGILTTVIPVQGYDWVAPSPSGRYFVVQYARRGTGPTEGTVVYDLQTGTFAGHVSDHFDHGDLGVDASGADLFVTMGFTDTCENGTARCYSVARLPDAVERGEREHLYPLTFPIGTYTSCRNSVRTGFCLSSDEEANPGTAPFASELWLTRLSDGTVRRLAHHRSSACTYYLQTRPTLSRTGRYLLFTSDWAAPNCESHGDLYLIDTAGILDGWVDGAR